MAIYRFASKHPFLKVCVVSEQLTVLADGTKRVIGSPQYVQFKYSVFRTENKSTVELLKRHPSYNRHFHGPYILESTLTEGDSKLKIANEDNKADLDKILAQAKKKVPKVQVKRGIVDTSPPKESVEISQKTLKATHERRLGQGTVQ